VETRQRLGLGLVVLIAAMSLFAYWAPAARAASLLMVGGKGTQQPALDAEAAGSELALGDEQIIDVPPDPPGGALPATGAHLISWSWAGGLLLLAGALIRQRLAQRRW